MNDDEKIGINNKSLINKIKENLSKREAECSLFSYDIDYDTNTLYITFIGKEEEKEYCSEYISSIYGKPRNMKEDIKTKNDVIHTMKFVLQFPTLEEIEIFIRIRIAKNKTLEEKMLDWSEGSEELYKLLLLLKDYGIETFACCSGHGIPRNLYVGFYVENFSEEIIKKVFYKVLKSDFDISVNFYNNRKRVFIYEIGSLELAELFIKAKNNNLDIDKASIEFKLTDYMFEKINEFNTNKVNVLFNILNDKVYINYTHFEENEYDIEEKDKRILDKIEEIFNSKEKVDLSGQTRKKHHSFGYTYKYKNLEDIYSKLKEVF